MGGRSSSFARVYLACWTWARPTLARTQTVSACSPARPLITPAPTLFAHRVRRRAVPRPGRAGDGLRHPQAPGALPGALGLLGPRGLPGPAARGERERLPQALPAAFGRGAPELRLRPPRPDARARRLPRPGAGVLPRHPFFFRCSATFWAHSPYARSAWTELEPMSDTSARFGSDLAQFGRVLPRISAEVVPISASLSPCSAKFARGRPILA